MNKEQAIAKVDNAICKISQGANIESTILAFLTAAKRDSKGTPLGQARIPAWEGARRREMIGPALPCWTKQVAIDWLEKFRQEFENCQ